MKTLLRSLKRLGEEWQFRLFREASLRGRYQFPSLLNARNLLGTAAEIGVYDGWYSNYLLTHWRGKRLISIDPWRAWGTDYRDDCNQEQPAMDRLCEAARRFLERHGNRSEIWRLTGAEAAARVPDATLDFVYIDAQHHEAAVMQDLNLWYPKVRPRGVLAGHDYLDGVYPYGVFGVKTAVDRFVQEQGLKLRATSESASPSWYLFKP